MSKNHKIYTIDDVVAKIRDQVALAGTQSAFARICGVAPSYLHDVINGRRWPGEKIVHHLGLTEIRGFVKDGG